MVVCRLFRNTQLKEGGPHPRCMPETFQSPYALFHIRPHSLRLLD